MSAETNPGYCNCRFCGTRLHNSFVDLGMSPLCQTHISPEQLNHMEPFYPLHAYVCHECFLVQLDEYVSPGDIFSDYAYFSSYSDSWVEHARRYAVAMTERFGLGPQSRVVPDRSRIAADPPRTPSAVRRLVEALPLPAGAGMARMLDDDRIGQPSLLLPLAHDQRDAAGIGQDGDQGHVGEVGGQVGQIER